MSPDHWKRVKDVAGGAWDYVARNCGSDEGLRRDVLSLLRSMAAADGVALQGFPAGADSRSEDERTK